MMSHGIKTGPTRWVRSWNQRNRDLESILGENDSGERSRANMALFSCFLSTVPGYSPLIFEGVVAFSGFVKSGRITNVTQSAT